MDAVRRDVGNQRLLASEEKMRESVACSLVFGALDDLPGKAAQPPLRLGALSPSIHALLTPPGPGICSKIEKVVKDWAQSHGDNLPNGHAAADKAALLAPLARLLATAAAADGAVVNAVLLRTACKPASLNVAGSSAVVVPPAPAAAAVNKAPGPRAMAQIFSYPENTVIMLQLRQEDSASASGPMQGSTGDVILVDPFFRDAFLQQPATAAYTQLLQQLPRAFVGSRCQLKNMVALMVEQSRIAYLSHGLSCPPWRRFDAMLARWLPKHFTDTHILSPPSSAAGLAAGTGPQQQQQERSGGGMQLNDACLSERSDCSGSSAASDCTALCRFASDTSCCTATSSSTAANNPACCRNDSIMTVTSEPGSLAAATWSIPPAAAAANTSAVSSTSSSGVCRTASGMKVIHGFQIAPAEDADAAPASSAGMGALPSGAAGPDSHEPAAEGAATCSSSRRPSLADVLLPAWTLQGSARITRSASAGLGAAAPRLQCTSSAGAGSATNSRSSTNSQRAALAARAVPNPAAAAARARTYASFEPAADKRPDAWVTFADIAATGATDASNPVGLVAPVSRNSSTPVARNSDSSTGSGSPMQVTLPAADDHAQQQRQQQKQQASLVRRLPLLPESAKRSCLPRDYNTICVIKLPAASAAAGSPPMQQPAAPTTALSGLRVRSWCEGCK